MTATSNRPSAGFEPWVTNGEIIAGLEPPEDSIRAIDWITSVGAIPTVCVFRPLIGTEQGVGETSLLGSRPAHRFRGGGWGVWLIEEAVGS